MRIAAPLLFGLFLAACSAPNGGEGGDVPPGGDAVSGGAQSEEPEPVAEHREADSAEDALAAEKPVALSLGIDGLRLIVKQTGSARPLDFGTARATVETAAANALNAKAKRSENDECPAGPMAFTDFGDLSLHFQDDRFVGWSISDASKLTTMDGIGIGSKRADISDTRTVSEQQDSTLGTELLIGGPDSYIVAILSGPGDDARVTDLWAGTSCVFR